MSREGTLHTILARLELCSTASTQAFNPDGGPSSENPGGKRPPGVSFTAADWYRWRLHLLDRGRPLRVDGEHGGKTRDTHARLLADARRELQQITGRTDRAPQRVTAEIDKPGGIEQLVCDEAPGKPAEAVALHLGLTVFQVRRIYVAEGLDPSDGSLVAPAQDTADVQARARVMAEKGYSERQIRDLLGLSSTTQVRRALGKAA